MLSVVVFVCMWSMGFPHKMYGKTHQVFVGHFFGTYQVAKMALAREPNEMALLGCTRRSV